MELIKREMPANYEIIDTGDWHLGVANTNEGGILEMLDYVGNNENVYLILKGDMIDAITSQDKRFSLTSFRNKEVTTPQEQADRLIEILYPYKDRILLMLMGNHEYKTLPTFDFLKYWSKHLNVPWGGIMSKFIHMNNGMVAWKGLLTHGNGTLKSAAKDPIQAEANMKANLKKKLQHICSDCVYMSMGHAHRMILVQPTIHKNVHLVDDGKKLKHMYRVDTPQNQSYIDVEARFYACNGSFLSTFSQPGEQVIPYSELALYSPVEQGYIKLTISDHKLSRVERVVL